MASYSTPRLFSFLASGAILRGQAVKLSADKTVVAASANTDDCIGIAQEVAADGEQVEVALPGGGGVALAGEGLTRGKLVVAGAGGKLFQSNASADRVIGMVMESAVLNDLVAVEILVGVAVGADD